MPTYIIMSSFPFLPDVLIVSYVQGDMNEALDAQGFSFLCGELACVAGAWNVVGTRKNGEQPFSLSPTTSKRLLRRLVLSPH